MKKLILAFVYLNTGFFGKYFSGIRKYGGRAARNTVITLACIAGALALAGEKTKAATYHVNPGQSIQARIDDPNIVHGDEIIVSPARYVENINFIGKNITLRSTEPTNPDIVANTILDGNKNGSVVTFDSGEDANCVLNGFMITNGYSLYGGGVYCSSSSTVVNCRFNDNSAERFGGGIYNSNGDLTLINCVLNGNSAKYGGGIGNWGDSLDATNCTFSENSSEEGGGIHNISNLTLTNCRFNDNSAERFGGGIYNSNGDLTLINCVLNGNSANIAGSMGGAICVSQSSPLITNCTFSNNYAWQNGGISFVVPPGGYKRGDVVLTNCLLWTNKDNGGVDESAQIYNYKPVVNYCCIQGLTGKLGGIGNINVNPLFVDPNNGDYHLQPNSLCIDAGNNAVLPPDRTDLDGDGNITELIPFDLDGNPRILNHIVDMGAYERLKTLHVNTLNGDDTNDGSSPKTAFATIQRGIDLVEDGYTVLVHPGTYTEAINFKDKAITVKSADYPAVIEAPDDFDFAVSFYRGEGPDSILKNFVIRDSLVGIFITRSSPTLSNLTIVDNDYGIEAYVDSVPDISNCIIWDNTYSDLYGCQARYSCIERGSQGEGNFSLNPRFADSNDADYHLLSQRGRYWPGHDIWVLDNLFSPCIDGGDPDSDYSNERKPNGGRINMGAYGGTPYASMKEMIWNQSDINHDDWVNFMDFAMLVENWLKYQQGTSNHPPKVNITSPEDGDSFDYTVEIWADANDIDGLVRKVEFFANKNKIGEDNDGSDGWKTHWQNNIHGDYSLTAKATDDDGATTISPAVGIRIPHPPPPPPKPPGMPGCFPAETPVWVDGAQVQISKVAAGQKVGRLDATDAASCLQKPACLKEIESIHVYQGTYDYYDIVLENGNRINVVNTHYFLIASDRWVLVQNLKVGSKLQSLKGPISIKTISKREEPFTDKLYNLEIKGGNRYFVGKDGVAVRAATGITSSTAASAAASPTTVNRL